MELAGHSHRPGEPLGPRPVEPPGDDDPSATTSAGGAGGKDLENALTLLRARVDEEFRISERLDAKGRQAFALAAAFFAIVQTVAFGSFQQTGITPSERVWLLTAVVVAGLSVVHVAHKLRGGEDLMEEADIRPEAIIAWWNEAPKDDPDYVSVRLLRELSRVAGDRAANNEIRQRNYDAIANATRLALIVAGVELVTAVLIRL